MSKENRDKRGNTKEQRLRNEVRKLKRENDRLHKLLSRLDLDRNDVARELIDEYHQQELANNEDKESEELKKDWLCKTCQEGYLEIVEYSKAGVMHYFRKCSNRICKNRTRGQILTSNVKGIRAKGKA